MSEELKLLPCPACGFTGEEHYINLQSNFYSIKCSTCGLETGIEHTLQDAVDTWNSLPRALTWTTKPPTVDDQYYWALFQNLMVGVVKIVSIQGELYALIAGSESECPLSDFLQWAGPIPIPKEPHNV